MKFACRCGHTITDQTDALPYKGFVSRDKFEEQDFARATHRVTAFLEACMSGARTEWLQQTFGAQYPVELSTESILFDLMYTDLDRHRLSLYQCAQCGRLWLENWRLPGSDLSFLPEHAVFDALDTEHHDNEHLEG